MTRLSILPFALAGALAWQGGAPPAKPAPGTVQGIVIRGDTGGPLADVRVTLSGGLSDPKAVQALLAVFESAGIKIPPPAPGESGEKIIQSLIDAAALRGITTAQPAYQTAFQQFRTANEERFSAVSDTEGHFTIEGVPPSEYTVRGQRDSFFGPSADAATLRVKIVSGETAGARLSLLPGAVIGGRISDGAGQSLPNVAVTAYRVTYRDGVPQLQPVTSRTTDDRGDYRLFWFAPGEYLIAAAPPPPVTSGAQDARGGRGAAIGLQAPGLPKPQTVATYYPGTADAASAARVVVARSEISGIDIRLQTVVPAKVSGQIRFVIPESAGARGALPASADIMLLTRDVNTPEPIAGGVGDARLVGTATLSAGEGKFEVGGVLPGSYDLYVRFPFSGPEGPPSVYARAPVDVRGENVSGVSIVGYPHVRVNGVVSIDGRAPGKTVIRIGLRPEGSAAKIPLYQALARRPLVAAEDGTFMIPGVTPGPFRVDVMSLPPELYVADILQGGASVFDSGIELGGASPAPLQVVVRSGTATLAGIAKDVAGNPLPGASVVLVPAAERRQNRALYAASTADSEGRFTIQGVAPGAYKVFGWETAIPPGAYFNAGFLARYEERGQPVSLTQMSTADITITAFRTGE